MSQKGEAPPWAMGLQKAPKTPGKLFPVPAVNPQPSSILAQNPGVLDQKTPPCSQSCPNPRCLCPFSPNRVQRHGFRVGFWGGMGGKGNSCPFFFPHRPLSLQRASSPAGSSPTSSSSGSSTSSGPSSPGPRYFWDGDGDRGDTGGSPRLCQTLTAPPMGLGTSARAGERETKTQPQA